MELSAMPAPEWMSEGERAALYLGDCRQEMASLPAEFADSIVTDPPYGLSFMGKDWDHGVPGEAFWREAMRVAKPGAYLLAFGGTRTYHRLACAIEDAGWEIRDCVMWVYGSGFPKSHNLKGEWEGWGTALKPAYEPVIVARKPLIGTVAENVLWYGTGAINIDACRVGTDQIETHGKRNGTGNSLEWSKTVSKDGWTGVSHSGRWPSNLIHDGSDEVVAGFPNTASGTGAIRKNRPGMFGLGGDGQPNIEYGDSGSAARFFYCAKASKADRDEGCEGLESKRPHPPGNEWGTTACFNGESGDDAWRAKHPNLPRKNTHPTVKPTALMRYLCRLVTQPGGVILDPFMGSGSTGKAAIAEGMRFVGIEQQPEYLDIAARRIAAAVSESVASEGVFHACT